jgi:apolipoprotein N-acyltransferase
LFGISFPPFPLVVPVFLALVPLAIGIARVADRPADLAAERIGGGGWRSAARIGFWFGIAGYSANLYWIAFALQLYTKLAFLGFAATIACFGVFGGATAALLFHARRATRWPLAALLPIVWVAWEFALAHLGDLAFPWLPLGLATAEALPLAQLAELGGVHLVSVVIAAVSGLLADAWLLRAQVQRTAARAGIAAALLAAAAGWGAWRMRTLPIRAVAPIGIVQPNIPQEEKWQEENRDRIVGILGEATRALIAAEDPALVVWPEVALPGFLAEHREWRDSLRVLADPADTPILFGVLDIVWRSRQPRDYEYYNAAMLADTNGIVRPEVYRKGYLVPIVERVPFLNPRWFQSVPYFGGFGRGRDAVVYRLAFGEVSALICYESIFPPLSRSLRRAGADVLLNITNDAWFGRTAAPYQHEAHLALRAIENRVGVVRSANTGISEAIDPAGRRTGPTDLFVPAIRTYEATTTDIVTMYTMLGDWPGVGAFLAALALAARARLTRKRPPPAAAQAVRRAA